jgi:predicted Na+-dependent transporter
VRGPRAAVPRGARGPLAAVPRLLTPLALLAAALALVVPSATIADHSDLLLAVLVLATALGISFADLARIGDHAGAVAFLSIVPFVALGAVAWLLGLPFSAPVRHGLLAVGLSSSEVAAVGLVALAGADAAVALGAVTGSLIVAAIAGPLLIGPLTGSGAAHVDSLRLLGRFALVVILPLILGVGVRSARPLQIRLAGLDPEREGVAAVTVAVLVYAALSATAGAQHLAAALLASLLFLAVSAALAECWRRRAHGASGPAGALVIAMRDFAVAAALATQAFGTSAGAVPGIYGVAMLVAGTVAAGRLSGLAWGAG